MPSYTDSKPKIPPLMAHPVRRDTFLWMPHADPPHAYIVIGKITLFLTVNDEGSVGVSARRTGAEQGEELASLYVSWQEVLEGHPQ